MDAALMLLYLVAAGVNYGWQPAKDADGGYEYIVQVEPELLDTMRRGEADPIESNVPPDVAPIRKVRIVVGRGELPRNRSEQLTAPPTLPARTPLRPTVTARWSSRATSNERYPAAVAALGSSRRPAAISAGSHPDGHHGNGQYHPRRHRGRRPGRQRRVFARRRGASRCNARGRTGIRPAAARMDQRPGS